MIVQQMLILTLSITNTRTHKHTYTPCAAATDSVDVIVIGMAFHLIHYRNVHSPYKVLFLSFPQYLQPLYGGFYTRNPNRITAQINPKFLLFPHAAVCTQIPFSPIETLQFHSLSIAMFIRFVIDVLPSRDCVECSDPI